MKIKAYPFAGAIACLLFLATNCTKEELPAGIQIIPFSNSDDASRIEQTHQVIPLRTIKGVSVTAGYDYVFTEVATVGSPQVNAVPVHASHIRYDNDHLFVAYNTDGEVCAGGWEVLGVSDPANPVAIYNTGVAGAEYSSVDVTVHPVSGKTNAMLVGSREEDPYYEAFLHAWELPVSMIPTGDPLYRALDGYCGTDISGLGIVSGTGGKFYLLNASDYLAPAVTYDLGDARSCDLDENSGEFVALTGQPGKLVYGLPNGTVGEIALGGLSFASTKAIMRIFDGRAYVALGDGGLAVVDLASKTVVSTLAAPATPLGENTQNYVTNGVSVTPDGLIFLANGAAGVYVAREDRNTNTIETLGFLDLNSSVNFVESHGEYLFVATGTKGVSIIHINGLRSVHDTRDNQWYETVMIGNQYWMAENIRYNDPDHSLVYDGDAANEAVYGRLYDATGAQTACPPGWRLPSHDDFKTLELFLGMDPMEVDMQNMPRGAGADVAWKMMATDRWSSTASHTNSSGLTLYGGGMAGEVTPDIYTYLQKDANGIYWTSEGDPGNAGHYLTRMVMINDPGVYYVSSSLLAGGSDAFFSVRCVRDN